MKMKKGLRDEGAAMSSTVAAMAFGALAMGGTPAAASLSPQERSGVVMVYDIPAGSVATALNAFAVRNGLHLLYEAHVTRALRTPGLLGAFSVREGLDRLLVGTGLTYRFGGPDETAVSIILAQNDRVRSDAAGAESLPPIDVGAERAAPAGRPGNGSGGDAKTYSPKNTSTATKTDTPIMETPFSVKAVPQQVLQDQQVTRVEKALQNVSGVLQMPSNQGGLDVFLLRGFSNDTIYRDGFLLPSVIGGGATKRNTANLERIEVLKGPGSILYGRSEPGGIINLVTKQPLETPYHAIQQQVGSFDNYRTTIDSTGPITKDGSLLYRFNMAYENLGSFRDFVHNEGVFIAPVVRWNISPATQVTAEFEYQQFDGKPDPGIPPIGNWPAQTPRSRFVGDPLNDRSKGYRVLAGFHWSHEFDQDWKILHRFTYEHMSIDSRTLFFGKASADGTLNRSFNIGADTNTDRFYTTVNLLGNVETGPIKHKLLFGFDFFHIDDNLTNNCCTPAPAFNIFFPAYLPAMLQFNNPALSTRLDYSQEWYSFYFQDQIELSYNFFVLGGLRYDSAVGRDNIRSIVSTNDNRVSPRGGLLWRPAPWLSVYGSYSESFGASNSLFNTDGTILKPQTAQQWEVGAKTEFLDGRLSATLAYFDLTKQNLPMRDPVNPTITRTIGEAKSQGVEFDLGGEITPGWRVIGAYSYLPFAQITRDSDAAGGFRNQGKRLFLAPRHWGSLWSTYEFQTPELAGLKVGAGFVAVGPRPGNAANNYEVPGYTTVNMMASYSWWFGATKCTAQINIDNLLDKPYFVGSNSGNFIAVGAPRSVLGSLKVEF